MKTINDRDKVPSAAHFAAIEFSSIYVPGQGEWAAGHGYPGGSEPICRYIIFDNAEEMQKYVAAKENPVIGSPDKAYFVFECNPLKVTKRVTVEVTKK